MGKRNQWLLFDWGNTLMRVFPQQRGPMYKWPHVETMPGVIETLVKLQGKWHFCLATNATDSHEDEIQLALKRVSLEKYIERIYCYRNLGIKKPSAAFFTKIMKDLGISTNAAIMIGDDFNTDVTGAVNAGIQAVWYHPDGREDRKGEKYCTIHRFSELPEALKLLEITANRDTSLFR